ncbi:hypothetical protein E2C01_093394 [Portunus trituberculatus]|uniref:Uncharacterized protein n=1 Tax=Portunus trituberculatus TaxID=210409 RepID=A0A5B7K0E0_PORTR|nr:hypothetical protein [Portunus trituberculatus]
MTNRVVAAVVAGPLNARSEWAWRGGAGCKVVCCEAFYSRRCGKECEAMLVVVVVVVVVVRLRLLLEKLRRRRKRKRRRKRRRRRSSSSSSSSSSI